MLSKKFAIHRASTLKRVASTSTRLKICERLVKRILTPFTHLPSPSRLFPVVLSRCCGWQRGRGEAGAAGKAAPAKREWPQRGDAAAYRRDRPAAFIYDSSAARRARCFYRAY